MISVNIATHKKRERFLKNTLQSLLNCRTKADEIRVYLNDYRCPKWLSKLKKEHSSIITYTHPKGDLGAAAKFYQSENQNKGVYITIDDDLVVDPGYIGYMADLALTYPGSLVGLHGTNYKKFPVDSFYRGDREIFYCYTGKADTSVVDMLGSGVLAFRASMSTKPTLEDFPKKRMTDPYLFKWAKKTQTPMICPVRADGFVKEQPESQEGAIWKDVAKSDAEQTKVINSSDGAGFLEGRKMPKPAKRKGLGGASIEWVHLREIIGEWNNESGDLLVEFGSGLSTKILSGMGYVTSFEHNKKYHVEGLTEFRPIKSGWYGLTVGDAKKIKEASVVVIDGPTGSSGERYNIDIDLLPKQATIFVDDVHRELDLALAQRIALRLKKELILLKGSDKLMAKLV